MPDAVPRTLAGATWPDLPERPLLLVPLGAVEQHGHHLPLATDTTVACAVAEAAAGDLDGALLAPALAYGASGEHEDFPGTVSIGTEALTGLLVEYGRSACRWAGRLVLVNGHGGNLDALRTAGTQLRTEGRDVAWFPCGVAGADAHAGRTETSLMLHVEPDVVREDRAVAGDAKSAELARVATRQLDKAASAGVIHKNQAANRKSAIAAQAAKLS